MYTLWCAHTHAHTLMKWLRDGRAAQEASTHTDTHAHTHSPSHKVKELVANSLVELTASSWPCLSTSSGYRSLQLRLPPLSVCLSVSLSRSSGAFIPLFDMTQPSTPPCFSQPIKWEDRKTRGKRQRLVRFNGNSIKYHIDILNLLWQAYWTGQKADARLQCHSPAYDPGSWFTSHEPLRPTPLDRYNIIAKHIKCPFRTLYF